jgi:methylenetetrahydrofolate dehydrogenase (NADP+)/methenyltetrahydrofolate cyclohydrolase
MIFDGRALAADWQNRLQKKLDGQQAALAVVLVGEDPASQTFVKIKQKFGEAIGVEVSVREYDGVITTEELIEIIEKLNDDSRFAGIIVQLPLPAHIDTDQVIAAITPIKDVDALGSGSSFAPPTVRVIEEVFKSINLDPAGRPALVIGQGRLVGRPAAVYLAQAGAEVTAADQDTTDLKAKCLVTDIIVTGTGRAGLITSDMIKPGAVLVDFGTSRPADKILGDIDPTCADRASFFTPTPGGTGPVTVAMLFANLLRHQRG